MTDHQTQAARPVNRLAWALMVAFPLVVVGLWILTNIFFESRIKALETQVEIHIQTLAKGQEDRYTGTDAARDFATINDRLEKLENGD